MDIPLSSVARIYTFTWTNETADVRLELSSTRGLQFRVRHSGVNGPSDIVFLTFVDAWNYCRAMRETVPGTWTETQS